MRKAWPRNVGPATCLNRRCHRTGTKINSLPLISALNLLEGRSVLAVGVVRRAARPQQIFVRVAFALTTVSFALPLAPSHTTTSARLLLAGGHVLAAAIVISGLTWAIRRAPRHLQLSHAAEKRA
ncbi:DUF6069 family protein [Nonomuraea sp. NPDC050536]|uniref:DUF6069 family protein n=1 Tax=Nonomuraea sp. NPDC050536 TaxID=3364366 RepID=UPI0037C5C0BC